MAREREDGLPEVHEELTREGLLELVQEAWADAPKQANAIDDFLKRIEDGTFTFRFELQLFPANAKSPS